MNGSSRLPAPVPRRVVMLILSALTLPTGAQAAVPPAAPSVVAPAASGNTPAVPEARSAEDAESLPRFDVLEFDVDGNTVLEDNEIERAVYPYLGPQHSMKDVEAARDSLQSLYQSHGYLTVSVDIPEQKVDGGVVRLRVMEGRVDRVRVVDSHYYSLGYIKERLPEIAQDKVPYFPEVRQELADLNKTPDRRVAPVLRPGKYPGTVDVDLEVQDKLPLHGDVELNNRYNEFTHPLRLSGSLRYDNLWDAEHSFALQYQLAPQHAPDSSVLSATYVLPLGANSLAVYAVKSKSDVVPGAFDTVGNGTIAGMRYIVPLDSGNGVFHSLTLGIDHKVFGETVRLQGQDARNTPITYTPLLLQYAGAVVGERSSTQFNLTANLDLAETFGNKDIDFENKRDAARANYLSLRFDLSRLQGLPGGWSLFARTSGQLTGSPLISNEQLALGGADTVRGYLEAENLGDIGIQGTLELRTPMLWPAQSQRFSELYALVFIDGGAVKSKQQTPGTQPDAELVSGGLGLRLRTRQGLRLGLDLAHLERNSAYSKAGDSRAEFKIGQEF